jgi:hypothetical protein
MIRLLLVLCLLSVSFSDDSYRDFLDRSHVQFAPALTAESAPYALEKEPVVREQKKRVQAPIYSHYCNPKTRMYRGQDRFQRANYKVEAPVEHRKVFVRRDANTDCYDRECCCCTKPARKRRVKHEPDCEVKTHYVRQVNGGAVKYVMNGRVKICKKTTQNVKNYENFEWGWHHRSPYYTKKPIFLNKERYIRPMVNEHYGERVNTGNDQLNEKPRYFYW